MGPTAGRALVVIVSATRCANDVVPQHSREHECRNRADTHECRGCPIVPQVHEQRRETVALMRDGLSVAGHKVCAVDDPRTVAYLVRESPPCIPLVKELLRDETHELVQRGAVLAANLISEELVLVRHTDLLLTWLHCKMSPDYVKYCFGNNALEC